MMKAKRKPKAKNKRKTKPGLKNWLVSLFQPIPIDFTVYLPLEECVSRLESCDRHSWWRSVKTSVTITSVDEATYAFHIERNQNGLGFVKAEGYLQQGEENDIHICGKIYSQLVALHIGAFLCFVLFATYYLISRSDPGDHLAYFASMWTFGVIIEIFMRLYSRPKLVEMIETTLGY